MAKTVELDQSENSSLTSYQLDNRGVLLDLFEPQFPGKMGTIQKLPRRIAAGIKGVEGAQVVGKCI